MASRLEKARELVLWLSFLLAAWPLCLWDSTANAQGWPVLWWMIPSVVGVAVDARLCVGWRQVRAKQMVFRRRRLLSPLVRWGCGLGLRLVLCLLVVSTLATVDHRPLWQRIGLMLMAAGCLEQLIEIGLD